MIKFFKAYFLREIIALIFVVIAVYLSSRAMFHEGFFRTIDDVTTVRIDYLSKELQRGLPSNFPVRIGGEMTHHYGYFFYLFYAPLVYYVGAIFMIFGHLSDIIVTKAVYALPLIFGPLLFYWCSRIKLSRLSSVVATVLFAYFPYRGFDAYYRGGVGENWAIAFIPGLFAGIFLLERKSKWAPLIISLFLALIVVSHNISALLVFALVLIYGLFFHLHNKTYWLSLLLGLGLSAFFFIPSIYYLSLIRANTLPLNSTNVFSSLIPLKHLISFTNLYLPSQSYSPLFFYLLCGGTLYFIFAKKIDVKYKIAGLFWFVGSLFLYLIMAEPFYTFWQYTLPITRMLQFVWRVFILLSFSIPLAVGYWVEKIMPTILKYLLALFVIYLCSLFNKTFHPAQYSYFYEYHIEDTGPCATADFQDYFPEWVKECIDRVPEHDVFLTEPGDMVITNNQVIKIDGTYNSELPNRFMIHRYYFPGWQVLVDQKPAKIDYTFAPTGIMQADLPSGKHNFSLEFEKTKVMLASDFISLTSIIIWLALLGILFL